jgi:hypothetical protein
MGAGDGLDDNNEEGLEYFRYVTLPLIKDFLKIGGGFLVAVCIGAFLVLLWRCWPDSD